MKREISASGQHAWCAGSWGQPSAMPRGWKMSKEETAKQTKALADHGIHVEKPTPELMDGLKKIGTEMLADRKKKAGPEGEALLKAYQQ